MDARAQQPPSTGRGRVVVGVDGSPGSRDALRLALAAAARRGTDLDVVSSYPTTLVWTGESPIDVPDADAVAVDTARRLGEFVVDARSSDDAPKGSEDLPIRLLVAPGSAAQALVDAAEDADLLVVGSRGRGGLRSALLGSVALHCATHASCPVLVVHPAAEDTSPSPQIVVGVDGSPESRAALEEAVRTGTPLEVVAAYEREDYRTDLCSVLTPTFEQIQARVRSETDALVAEAMAELPSDQPVPEVRTTLFEDAAGDALVAAARGAALLVVGCRGHGSVRGLLLGSVALHCAMHAPCPVLVVHPHGAVTTSAEVPERRSGTATASS